MQKQSDSSRMESLRFEKFRTDGKVASGICLEGEIVAVLRTEYEGWATVWTHETQPLIAQLIEACAEARSIVGLRLHYINEFSCEEVSTTFRADMVLRQGNSYVPPYVFERSGTWQCNTSFVDELKEPERLTLDHHLNFYVADETLESSEQKGTYLSIVSDHGIAFPVPQAVDAFVKHDGACLGNFMNKLHDVHKGVIGQVLNDPIIAQIGLYS